MPRFVLLRHECPADFGRPSHWDLMLEWGDRLRTWALPNQPLGELDRTSMPIRQLADHRIEYLEYEGSIRGNRGTVHRVAAGHYRLVSAEDDQLEVELRSDQCSGHLVLRRQPVSTDHWRLDWRST